MSSPSSTSPARLAAEPRPLLDLVRVYCYYRLLVAGLLVILGLLEREQRLFGSSQPGIYMLVSGVYAAYSLVVLVAWVMQRQPVRSRWVVLATLGDILALGLLSHASGGPTGGISILMAVSVAAAAASLDNRLSLLVAAVATLTVLADGSLHVLHGSARLNTLLVSALLGILFFSTSFAIRQLAQRIASSQAFAAQSAENVARLQELNQLVVQRLRTGIVVVNAALEPHLANEAAGRLLGLREDITQLPELLRERLLRWQQAPWQRQTPFRVAPEAAEVQANFTVLGAGEQAETLIFLEDTRQMHQQAQQLKLASLGRLTASIAHEIRNPLGAISHAVQLLLESEHLDKPDRRLADIILNHSRRMNQVSESVLSLSRRNPARQDRLPLADWLNDYVLERSDVWPTGAEIEVRVEPLTLAVGFDPAHLGQVLDNLVGNGLRYSERATGRPHVVLQAGMGSQDNLPLLDVIDDGPGVPTADAHSIFEPFFTTEGGGTGLGLYIARELCEANQAQLACRRADDGRSCFRITFAHPDRRLIGATD